MWGALFLVFGGCRLAIDVDEPMCVSDADCVDVGMDMVCGSAGVCVQGAAEEDEGSSRASDYGSRSLEEWRERYPCLFDDAPVPDYSVAGETVLVSMSITDYATMKVPDDLRVDACGILDANCEAPILAGIYPDIFLGLVSFQLPHGFRGYLKIQAGDYLPVRWSSNAPLLDDIFVDGPAMLKPGLVEQLALQSGEFVDPSAGMLVVDMLDCDGEPAEGVVLRRSGDLNERAFYFANTLPDTSLPASEISTTIGTPGLARSVGGFINLSPGTETIRATLLGTDIAFADETVLMRASTVTYLRLYAGAAK